MRSPLLCHHFTKQSEKSEKGGTAHKELHRNWD
jgi:hypothetical protein